MKISNLLPLFFLVLMSISAHAQSNYHINDYELQPVFDTLFDGTIINLLDGTIVESSSNHAQLKSVKISKNELKEFLNKKQLNSVRNKQLKSAQLIKSLNQETSPYYTEKLDSVVEYDAILYPVYDSTTVEKSIQKYNENGYLVESILQVYDSISSSLINSVKYEYIPDEEGRLLQQLVYSWTGDIWNISSKKLNDYNSDGNQALSVTYNWDGNSWINSQKTETVYDSVGNITISASFKGDGTVWIKLSKSEYELDINGNRTLINYFRGDENNEWSISLRYEYSYYGNGNRATYNLYSVWNEADNRWDRHHETNYNEKGQPILYSLMIFNNESKEWEYDNKLEYEYLEDESTVEKRFAWLSNQKVFYLQSQIRYKTEKQFENDKLIEELRLVFLNGKWESSGRKVFDQWGNEVLYEAYDPYNRGFGELRQQIKQSFSETGQILSRENYVWELDENYNVYKNGVQFYEYKRDTEDNILSYTQYKWDEEKEDWLVDWKDFYNYTKEGEQIIEKYNFNVDDYIPEYERGYKTNFEYDSSIGRYTAIWIEGDNKEDATEVLYAGIIYNNAKKVKAINYFYSGKLYYKMECYYDELGRDSLWKQLFPQTDGDTSISYVQFDYKEISETEMEITEFYFDNQPDTLFSETGEVLHIYTDDLIKYTLNNNKIQKETYYDFENGDWVVSGTSNYTYNNLGQIVSGESENSEESWKIEIDYNNNDTLNVRYYFNYNSSNSEWEWDWMEVYVVDPNISKNQVQPVPKPLGNDELTMWVNEYLLYDYGKPLVTLDYTMLYFENNDSIKPVINKKVISYYSPASALQGESIISGYIFNDSDATKSIEITKSINGEPVEGAVVSLCASEDNYVLASDITGVDGFYEFKGVPEGNFYIKVEVPGYEQTSKHEIEITKDAVILQNMNYQVHDGEVAVGIDELKFGIQIFPNPTTNFVLINAHYNIDEIKITDLNGRSMLFKSGNNSKNMKVSTQTFPEGLYIFEVEINHEIYREKVIVKK